jgi:formylglycine-generating enzyme required for sulfatase activity
VGQSYRLPTDAEWSKAVGLRENESGTPEQKNGVAKWQYPWGTDWPPPREVGNYAGHEAGESNWPYGWQVMAEHRDKYPRTSPVGSFLPRVNGLYDMGGNVGEWCEDKYKADAMWRVLRGASWGTNKEEHLLSSHREYYGPNDRYSLFGFRCVVSYQ